MKKKTISRARWGYLFILPFFLTYLIFSFIPLVDTIRNSFFEYYRSGLKTIGPNFVGLENYIKKGQGNPNRTSYTLIMWLNNFLRAPDYGRAGALSVYLFIISGILCFFVYRMLNDDDPDGSKAAAKRARREARKKRA